MEKALGEYTSKMNSKEDFRELLEELNLKLRAYLSKQEEKSWVSSLKKYIKPENAINILSNPEIYLRPKEKQLIGHFYGLKEIYIVTYNYTKTFERVFGIKDGKGISYIGGKISQIIHIHGTLDSGDPIIVGVDNPEQIGNQVFRLDNEVSEIFVKNQLNDALRNTGPDVFADLIKKSDMIVLYGVSMGETDARWWRMIGEEFAKRKMMIIRFCYSDISRKSARIAPFERHEVDNTMKKLYESIEMWPKDYKDRLFVSTDLTIFKMEHLETKL